MHYPDHLREAFLAWIGEGYPPTARVEVDYREQKWPAEPTLWEAVGHALELWALTKLNLNHGRLDGRDPMTTWPRAAPAAPTDREERRLGRRPVGEHTVASAQHDAPAPASMRVWLHG
jgi:hypothetical protein